jgi:hypothetical protein
MLLEKFKLITGFTFILLLSFTRTPNFFNLEIMLLIVGLVEEYRLQKSSLIEE